MNPRVNAAARQHRWRLAVVEDHVLQRRRTEELIAAQPGLRLVWSGETLPDFLAWLPTADPAQLPQLLILDLQVERGPSAEPDAVRRLTDAGMRVLVLSAMASPTLLRRMLHAGVAGVVGKRDPEEDIVRAIWTVVGRQQWMTRELAGIIAGDEDRPPLSDQERRALVLYATGLTQGAVAEAMGVTVDTVKSYLSRVKAKYADQGRDARTKIELRSMAVQDGYLEPPELGGAVRD